VVAEGLLDPIGILGAPDGTLLVNERAGRILALDPDGGEAAYEEIDRIDPKTQGGANLGWDVLEATHCYTSPNCEAIGIPPVAEYPTSSDAP